MTLVPSGIAIHEPVSVAEDRDKQGKIRTIDDSVVQAKTTLNTFHPARRFRHGDF
jgi:hypothetical protein